jgi:hypothetical protein
MANLAIRGYDVMREELGRSISRTFSKIIMG